MHLRRREPFFRQHPRVAVISVVRKAKQDLQDLQDEQEEESKVDIGNADIGLRRETLMNQTTYPLALRQDKKSFSTLSGYAEGLL